MKRIAILAITALTAIAPIAPAFADPPRYEQNDNRRDARDERRDERQDDRRDDRRGARWEAREHNGYMYRGRWHYGPPRASYYGRPGFEPGYHVWQRGERVPAYYRDRAHRVDYRQYRDMRAPPRGYQYVRDDRGTILLVGIATGVILSAILAQ